MWVKTIVENIKELKLNRLELWYLSIIILFKFGKYLFNFGLPNFFFRFILRFRSFLSYDINKLMSAE